MNGKKAILGGWAYFAAVVVTLLSTMAVSVVYYLCGNSATAVGYKVFSQIALFLVQLLFLGIAIVFPRIKGVNTDVRVVKPNLTQILFALAATVISIIGFYLITILFSVGLDAAGYKNGTSAPTGVGEWIAVGIRVIFFAPVCEEMLFRGAVLTGTNGICGGKREIRSVLLCGAAFMLLHMSPTQTVYQFIFGCVLAKIALSTRSIVPAIVAHAINNVIGYILISPAGVDFNGALAAFFYDSPAVFAVLAVVSNAAAVILLAVLFKGYSKKNARIENFIMLATETEHQDNTPRAKGIVLFAFAALICILFWTVNLVSGIKG